MTSSNSTRTGVTGLAPLQLDADSAFGLLVRGRELVAPVLGVEGEEARLLRLRGDEAVRERRHRIALDIGADRGHDPVRIGGLIARSLAGQDVDGLDVRALVVVRPAPRAHRLWEGRERAVSACELDVDGLPRVGAVASATAAGATAAATASPKRIRRISAPLANNPILSEDLGQPPTGRGRTDRSEGDRSAYVSRTDRQRGEERRMSSRMIVLATLSVVVLAGAMPAAAVPPNPLLDNDGKQWRQLYETMPASWSQVAQVCPRDGVTPCSGSIGSKVLTGWVWATAEQVVELMGAYEPAILTANPPSVSGDAYFGSAQTFLGEMRWTGYISTYTGYTEWTVGWTASTDEAGLPIDGRVGFGWWPPGGGFLVGSVADENTVARGVWLWRPSTDDLTAPVITPSVSGTLGSSGWYVSDVSVTWNVADPESEISSQAGCDPSTVVSDTAGSTFTCSATSAGGTSSASAVVQRDTTPPTVTCPSPVPEFEIYRLGAWVTASVTDATSGPASAPAQAAANTSTGRDLHDARHRRGPRRQPARRWAARTACSSRAATV